MLPIARGVRAQAALLGLVAALFPGVVLADQPAAPVDPGRISITVNQSGTGINVCTTGCVQNVQVLNVSTIAVEISGGPRSPVSVDPPALDFGPVRVGRSAGPRAVALRNAGAAAIAVHGLTMGGQHAADFGVSPGGCPTAAGGVFVLAAGARCQMSATFTPRQPGPRLAAVGFVAAGAQHWVPVVGLGAVAAATLAPAALDFGRVGVGQASPVHDLSLTNVGTAPVAVSGVASTGDFSAAADCGSGASPDLLEPGRRCAIHLRFAPVKRGSAAGTLTVQTDAQAAPLTAALTGTGVTPGARLTAAALDFGRVDAGKTSAPARVGLSNPGIDPLDVASIQPAGPGAADFQASSDCPSMLAPGAACAISVTFAPHSAGATTANLEVRDTAAGSPQLVRLAGTGLAPAPRLLPAAVDFGAVPVGGSATRYATLQNAGSAPLPVGPVRVGGGSPAFVTTSSCGPALPPGASCRIAVTFRPTTAAPHSTNVIVSAAAGGVAAAVAVRGLGAAVPPPAPQAAAPVPEAAAAEVEPPRRGRHLAVPDLGVAGDRPLVGGLPEAVSRDLRTFPGRGGEAAAAPTPPAPPLGRRLTAWLAGLVTAVMAAMWVALLLARRPQLAPDLVELDDGPGQFR